MVTATDNVLAYIFTSGTNKQSKCCVVTEIFRKLADRVYPHRDDSDRTMRLVNVAKH